MVEHERVVGGFAHEDVEVGINSVFESTEVVTCRRVHGGLYTLQREGEPLRSGYTDVERGYMRDHETYEREGRQ